MPSCKDLYDKWRNAVSEATKDHKHRYTCALFKKDQTISDTEQTNRCICGRLKNSHSYKGELSSYAGDRWIMTDCSGRIDDGISCGILYKWHQACLTKFLRCDINIPQKALYDLICNDYGKKPNLIISIFGGTKNFKMDKHLETAFMNGIIEAATSAGGWILTAGLNSGVVNLVGQAISEAKVMHCNLKNIVSIGFTKWGSLSQDVRDLLSGKFRKQLHPENNDPISELYTYPPEMLGSNNQQTVESHHAYMLLFDDATQYGYLGDHQPTQFLEEALKNKGNTNCYTITVIVEGGLNTPYTIRRFLEKNLPVVIIRGSGRMADIICDFLTPDAENASKDKIKEVLKKKIPNKESLKKEDYEEDLKTCANEIRKIIDVKYSDLLSVYSLNQNVNVAETIFNAIFKAKLSSHADNRDGQSPHRNISSIDMLNLLDLSLAWKSFQGLQRVFEDTEANPDQPSSKEIMKKFITSLENDSPKLADYFLRSRYNVLNDLKREDISLLYETISKTPHTERYISSVLETTNIGSNKPLGIADEFCKEFIGHFMQNLYSEESESSITNILARLKGAWRGIFQTSCRCPPRRVYTPVALKQIFLNLNFPDKKQDYSQQEKIRDLFLWSVFMGRTELAKVFLIYLEPKTCAALIASRTMTSTAEEFELYAVNCINACYELDEKRACELILRQITLFGNITCIQVAVAAKCRKFLLTACFDRVINDASYCKLDERNRYGMHKHMLILTWLSFGILAPFYVSYRTTQPEDSQHEPISNQDKE
ncbi:unnamed protein product [Rotaria socialis]